MRGGIMAFNRPGGRGIVYFANKILGVVHEDLKFITFSKTSKTNKETKTTLHHFHLESELQRVFFSYIVLISKELLKIKPFDFNSQEVAQIKIESLFQDWKAYLINLKGEESKISPQIALEIAI